MKDALILQVLILPHCLPHLYLEAWVSVESMIMASSTFSSLSVGKKHKISYDFII